MPTKTAPKRNKSAMKRARQAEKRKLRNQSIKSILKSLVKKVESEVINKNLEGARSALAEAVPAINKAASKGVIHRNTASRKVSRLTRLINSALSGAA